MAQLAEQRSPKPQVGGSNPSSRAIIKFIRLENMKEKIIKFFEDVVKEMKKVTWPTKQELKESTNVVIAVCIFIALFTYAIDLVITQLFKGIF